VDVPYGYRILPTTRFKKEFEAILEGFPGLARRTQPLWNILSRDPYNRSRQYNIKKLKDVPAGKGQFRIRTGRYRLRYDIAGNDVILYSFRHRKDAY
jgi:mRNA-degrading endonuclease RelE of RelBE toxin-antitoxin system